MRLDHVGIVVSSLEDGLELFEQRLGLATADVLEAGKVRAAFVNAGGPQLELIDLGDSGEQPPHIHHVAFAVDDLDALAELLSRFGVEIATRNETPAARTLMTKPETSGGIRLQFRQHLTASAGQQS